MYQQHAAGHISASNPGNGAIEADITLLPLKKIQSLKGIELFNKLETVDLHGNEIESIAPLAALQRLHKLDISGNKIRNLAALQDLPLQTLNAARNEIHSITPLYKLTGLTRLDLSDNQIANIWPVNAFKQLVSLDISVPRVNPEKASCSSFIFLVGSQTW